MTSVTTLILFLGLIRPNLTNASEFKSVFLAKGEQYELFFKPNYQFSIGNSEVIKGKFLKSQNKLLLKANSIGFSDLKIWEKGSISHYHFFVLSKMEYLNQVQLAHSLQEMGLEAKVFGPIIKVSGEISQIEDYITISALRENNPKIIFQNVTLKKEVRNKIYAQVYLKLYSQNASFVTCSIQNFHIFCEVENVEQFSAATKELTNQFYVTFLNYQKLGENYEIKFKLIKIAYGKNQTIDYQMGLVNEKIKDLISGQINILDKTLFLEEIDASMEITSEPIITTRLGQKNTLSLGSEIKYLAGRSNQNQSRLEWKFAGIKIDTMLVQQSEGFVLDYEAEFTSAQDQGIDGSKDKGNIYIGLNNLTQVFRIGYQEKSQIESSIPGINQISLFGDLFKSRNKTENFQEIIGVVYVKKIQ